MERFDSYADDQILDASDDGCSICLEPFSADDPATITNCKHDYHLQCILNWSQRSKECPICWQLLALKDPESQKLLAAIEIEKKSRARLRSYASSMRIPTDDFQFHTVPAFVDELDVDEPIMRHLGAAANARLHHPRRDQHRSSGLNQSESLGSSNASNTDPVLVTMHTMHRNGSSSVLPNDSTPTVILSPRILKQNPPSQLNFPSSSSTVQDIMLTPISRITASITPPASPPRSRSCELLSFSESLKTKLSAASSRCKESISKSTRGLKEKLMARNNSVKELSKEVQRDVTSGIAGVARMIERLDPTSKRVGSPTSVSSGLVGSSESFSEAERIHDDRSNNKNGMRTAQATSSNVPIHPPGRHSMSPTGVIGIYRE